MAEIRILIDIFIIYIAMLNINSTITYNMANVFAYVLALSVQISRCHYITSDKYYKTFTAA